MVRQSAVTAVCWGKGFAGAGSFVSHLHGYGQGEAGRDSGLLGAGSGSDLASGIP